MMRANHAIVTRCADGSAGDRAQISQAAEQGATRLPNRVRCWLTLFAGILDENGTGTARERHGNGTRRRAPVRR
ncbi:MAG: hypothetical protein ABGW95_03750, partial [Candidatus Poseidoniia archaeon]